MRERRRGAAEDVHSDAFLLRELFDESKFRDPVNRVRKLGAGKSSAEREDKKDKDSRHGGESKAIPGPGSPSCETLGIRPAMQHLRVLNHAKGLIGLGLARRAWNLVCW